MTEHEILRINRHQDKISVAYENGTCKSTSDIDDLILLRLVFQIPSDELYSELAEEVDEAIECKAKKKAIELHQDGHNVRQIQKHDDMPICIGDQGTNGQWSIQTIRTWIEERNEAKLNDFM